LNPDDEHDDGAEDIGLSLEEEIGAALDEAPDDTSPAAGRARDDAGRFAPAQAANPGQPANTQATQAADAPRAPVWYKADLGDWGQVPEPIRNAVLGRERDFSIALERHSEALRPWAAVSERIAPYADQLQAQGVAPEQFLSNLVGAHDALLRDPVGALQWIAESYGVDLSALAAGGDEDDGFAQDPRIQAMQAELQQLRGQVNQVGTAWQQQQQYLAQQQQSALVSEISAFSKDKPDFDTLRPMIATFLSGGQAESLADAYEQARWAHPETRQRILEDQRKADAAKAQRARANGTTLRGAPVNGAATRGPELTLEEELAALIDAA
jgi:hypothetical protein